MMKVGPENQMGKEAFLQKNKGAIHQKVQTSWPSVKNAVLRGRFR